MIVEYLGGFAAKKASAELEKRVALTLGALRRTDVQGFWRAVRSLVNGSQSLADALAAVGSNRIGCFRPE